MPNIKLATAVSRDKVRDILATRCPDLEVNRLGPGLTASRTKWVAAMVQVNGRTISVIPSVASVPMFLVMLLIMLTGLGLVIYAVAVIPKQQEIVRRVTAALQQELK
jgi:hypothetical protein